MAKYRHRTFEMFDFLAEATRALESKSAQSVEESDDPESWSFDYLLASRSQSVIHVRFKNAECFGSETLSGLRKDFSQLAASLMNDSRVLLDFEGVQEFCADSIETLALFNRKLQSKGSRIALCNLEPSVQASFFPHRVADESRS